MSAFFLQRSQFQLANIIRRRLIIPVHPVMTRRSKISFNSKVMRAQAWAEHKLWHAIMTFCYPHQRQLRTPPDFAINLNLLQIRAFNWILTKVCLAKLTTRWVDDIVSLLKRKISMKCGLLLSANFRCTTLMIDNEFNERCILLKGFLHHYARFAWMRWR